VGGRARAGAGRGDGDLGGARSGAAAGDPAEPALARQPPSGGVPLAHYRLAWLENLPEGREWLGRLPQLLEECAERWSLELEEPFPYAFASLAVPAGDVVLKVHFPGRESEHEAEALRVWAGDGAVRLLDHDAERHALLLERARPGTHLADVGLDRALDVFVDLLPRLWKPVGAPFRPLEEEAAWWIDHLPEGWEEAGRPFERRLLDAALDALEALAPTQGEQVLVHQDFHALNVVSAEREPWLTIDPKPLAGEREFGIAAIVRGTELGHSKREVLRRLDRLASELGLDRERARGWALGQTVAWGIGHEPHAEVARWLVEAA
jgi:streptomycin 6-kinase